MNEYDISKAELIVQSWIDVMQVGVRVFLPEVNECVDTGDRVFEALPEEHGVIVSIADIHNGVVVVELDRQYREHVNDNGLRVWPLEIIQLEKQS